MGVIRLNPSPTLKLGRLCVLPVHRQKGHAERLVNAVHEWVMSNANATTQSQPDQAIVWLHAQLPVIRFYEKCVRPPIHVHNQKMYVGFLHSIQTGVRMCWRPIQRGGRPSPAHGDQFVDQEFRAFDLKLV